MRAVDVECVRSWCIVKQIATHRSPACSRFDDVSRGCQITSERLTHSCPPGLVPSPEPPAATRRSQAKGLRLRQRRPLQELRTPLARFPQRSGISMGRPPAAAISAFGLVLAALAAVGPVGARADDTEATFAVYGGSEGIMFGFNFHEGGTLAATFQSVGGTLPINVGVCTVDQLQQLPGCPSAGSSVPNALDFNATCVAGATLHSQTERFLVHKDGMPSGPVLLVAGTCAAGATSEVFVIFEAVNPGGSMLSAGDEDAFAVDKASVIAWAVLLAVGLGAFFWRGLRWQGGRLLHPLAAAWLVVGVAQCVAAGARAGFWTWLRATGQLTVIPPAIVGSVSAMADGISLALLLGVNLGFGVVRWELSRPERHVISFIAACLAAVNLTAMSEGGMISGILGIGILLMAMVRSREFGLLTSGYVAFVADAFALAALSAPADRGAALRAGALWNGGGEALRRIRSTLGFSVACIAVWMTGVICRAWPPTAVLVVGDTWWVPVALISVSAWSVSAWVLFDVVFESPLVAGPGVSAAAQQRRRAEAAGRALGHRGPAGCLPAWARQLFARCPCAGLCGVGGAALAPAAGHGGGGGPGGRAGESDDEQAGLPLLGSAQRAPGADKAAPARRAQPDYAMVVWPAADGSPRKPASRGGGAASRAGRAAGQTALGVSPGAYERVLGARPATGAGSGSALEAAAAARAGAEGAGEGGLDSTAAAVAAAAEMATGAPAHHARAAAVARVIITMAGRNNPLLLSPGGLALQTLAHIAPPPRRPRPQAAAGYSASAGVGSGQDGLAPAPSPAAAEERPRGARRVPRRLLRAAEAHSASAPRRSGPAAAATAAAATHPA